MCPRGWLRAAAASGSGENMQGSVAAHHAADEAGIRVSLVCVGRLCPHHSSHDSCQCWSSQCPHRSRSLQLLLSPPALAVPTVSPQLSVSPQPLVSPQHPGAGWLLAATCCDVPSHGKRVNLLTPAMSHRISEVPPSVPGNAHVARPPRTRGSPQEPPGTLTPPVTSCHLPWRGQGVSQPFLEKRVKGAGCNGVRDLSSPTVTQGGVSTVGTGAGRSDPLHGPSLGSGAGGDALLPSSCVPPEPPFIPRVAAKPTSPQQEPGHSGEPPPPDVTSVPLPCCVETGSSGLISLKSPRSYRGSVEQVCVGSRSSEAAQGHEGTPAGHPQPEVP